MVLFPYFEDLILDRSSYEMQAIIVCRYDYPPPTDSTLPPRHSLHTSLPFKVRGSVSAFEVIMGCISHDCDVVSPRFGEFMLAGHEGEEKYTRV